MQKSLDDMIEEGAITPLTWDQVTRIVKDVTFANAAKLAANPMNIAAEKLDKAPEYIQKYRDGDLKEKQKKWHDQASHPDNSLAWATWASLNEASAVLEDEALKIAQEGLEAAKKALKSDDLWGSNSGAKRVEDLFTRHLEYTGQIDRKDPLKPKDEAEVKSRSGPHGKEQANSLVSAGINNPDASNPGAGDPGAMVTPTPSPTPSPTSGSPEY